MHKSNKYNFEQFEKVREWEKNESELQAIKIDFWEILEIIAAAVA